MIHLYAFVPPRTPLPPVERAQGVALRVCTVETLAAVVADEPDVTGVTREDAIAHGLVVEAVRELADAIVPVRFGERFRDEDALRAAVAGRAAELHAALERVRGCSEFGVRVVVAADTDVDAAADGTTYLRSRLAARKRADALTTALHEPLARHARARSAAEGDASSASYLVERRRQASFERALARAAAAHPEATVVCTGPWAPYSFAGGA